jgi:hypothetical protein
MDPFLRWMRDTPLGDAMRETPGLFPAAETAHFIGLSLLLGAMIVVDLRIVGFFRNIRYAAVLNLVPIAVAGFVINIVSGILCIVTNPFLYFTNPAFFLKLAVIFLGGVNALWFTIAEHRSIAGLPIDAIAPLSARIMAIASLSMWLLVIVLGRLLPTFAPVAGG